MSRETIRDLIFSGARMIFKDWGVSLVRCAEAAGSTRARPTRLRGRIAPPRESEKGWWAAKLREGPNRAQWPGARGGVRPRHTRHTRRAGRFGESRTPMTKTVTSISLAVLALLASAVAPTRAIGGNPRAHRSSSVLLGNGMHVDTSRTPSPLTTSLVFSGADSLRGSRHVLRQELQGFPDSDEGRGRTGAALGPGGGRGGSLRRVRLRGWR